MMKWEIFYEKFIYASEFIQWLYDTIHSSEKCVSFENF